MFSHILLFIFITTQRFLLLLGCFLKEQISLSPSIDVATEAQKDKKSYPKSFMGLFVGSIIIIAMMMMTMIIIVIC